MAREQQMITLPIGHLRQLIAQEVDKAIANRPLPRDVTSQELIDTMRGNLRAKFAAAFSDADSSFDEQQLRKDITAQLVQERRQIILKLLGLTEKYGQLEAASRGPFSNEMERVACKVLEEWIATDFENDIKNELNTMFASKKFRKEALEKPKTSFEWKAFRSIEEQSLETAEQLTKQLVAEFREQFSLNNLTAP